MGLGHVQHGSRWTRRGRWCRSGAAAPVQGNRGDNDHQKSGAVSGRLLNNRRPRHLDSLQWHVLIVYFERVSELTLGLKVLGPARGVRVRFPPSALLNQLFVGSVVVVAGRGERTVRQPRVGLSSKRTRRSYFYLAGQAVVAGTEPPTESNIERPPGFTIGT